MNAFFVSRSRSKYVLIYFEARPHQSHLSTFKTSVTLDYIHIIARVALKDMSTFYTCLKHSISHVIFQTYFFKCLQTFELCRREERVTFPPVIISVDVPFQVYHNLLVSLTLPFCVHRFATSSGYVALRTLHVFLFLSFNALWLILSCGLLEIYFGNVFLRDRSYVTIVRWFRRILPSRFLITILK